MTVLLFYALPASSLVAVLAFWRGYLTGPAAIAAACFGAVILGAAGIAAASSVAVCFFITALLSRRRDRIQHSEGVFRRARRDLGQILANAVLMTALALAIYYSGQPIWQIALLGCIGAVSGDTWASDLAQFSQQQARLVTTWEPVAAGTPGAVTPFGCLLSAAAGLVAATVFLLVEMIGAGHTSASYWVLLIAASAGGLFGALADSVLGAQYQALYRREDGSLTDHPAEADGRLNSYQKGWRCLSNNLVNFANSLVGALSAAAIGAVFLP